MIKKADSSDVKKIKKIKKVEVEEKSNFFFIGLIALLIVGTVGAVLFVASNRESALGVAPEVNVGSIDDDHWHYAYAIVNCGVVMPPSTVTDDLVGIHTHGQGLLHVHPNKPEGAGPNAKMSRVVESFGAELTEETYTPGPGEQQTVLSEEAGCDGEPAELSLTYWEDAYDEEADPTEVITTDIIDFNFAKPSGLITLALLPEGEEAPRPPIDRIILLSETDGVQYEPSEALLGDVAATPSAEAIEAAPGVTVEATETTLDGAEDGADATDEGADTTAGVVEDPEATPEP